MADRELREVPASAIAILAVTYLIAPGDPSVWFAGLPLDGPSLGVLVPIGLALALLRPRRVETRQLRGFAVAAGILIGLKAAIAFAAPVQGWKADYFANATLQPPRRVSTDFRGFDGTRIDRTLAFHDDTFPVFFFNENTFNRGIRRENSEPFSVRWVGYLPSDWSTSRATLTARGRATLSVDGVTALEISSGTNPQSASASLPEPSAPAARRLEVTYAKPPDTDGRVELTIDDGRGTTSSGAPLVRPTPPEDGPRAWTRPAAIAVNLVALGLLVGAFLPLRVQQRAPATWTAISDRILYSGLAVLFALQGFWKAMPLSGRFVSLSSGDDWLQFEAGAREILIGGMLMSYGKPFGEGAAYTSYPFYSYFLALVHYLTGEDLFGVIVFQFIVLLLATVLVHRLTRQLFGSEAALLALGLLLTVEQTAFVRYYTVTLLAENLFFLMVPATVYALTRFVQTGSLRTLIVAGLCGGLAAITKPSIMLMLPPAIVLVAAATRRHRRQWTTAVTHALAFATAWSAVVSLTLLRNYVVSGEPVLITTGQQWSFVLHNLPSSALKKEYIDSFDNLSGGYTATFVLLARLLWNYPVEFLGGVFAKVGFSLGMVHWLGSSVHPELLLLSAGYLASIIVFPVARQMATWPVHLFVATHLMTMVLTMPSIYGYRLILPMYLLFAAFAGLAASHLWSWGWSRWRDGSDGAGVLSPPGTSR